MYIPRQQHQPLASTGNTVHTTDLLSLSILLMYLIYGDLSKCEDMEKLQGDEAEHKNVMYFSVQ